MLIYGKCPHCGIEIQVEETPSSYVFIVDGKVVTDCPNCGEDLDYEDVTGRGQE